MERKGTVETRSHLAKQSSGIVGIDFKCIKVFGLNWVSLPERLSFPLQ
jgi:hypothetical protein